MLCPTLHQHEREVTLLDRLMHGTTDGAVLMLPEESNEELEALAARATAFVSSTPACRSTRASRRSRPRTPRAPAPRPSTCSRSGTGASARSRGRAVAREHRAPATAITRALAAAGVLPDPALVRRVGLRDRGRCEAARRCSTLPDPPTAIFAFNDNMALGAHRAARERGLRVPEDLSVVGFDDSEQAAIVTPALTTVRQPLAEMGRMAVSLLCACSRTSGSRRCTSSSRRGSWCATRPRRARS